MTADTSATIAISSSGSLLTKMQETWDQYCDPEMQAFGMMSPSTYASLIMTAVTVILLLPKMMPERGRKLSQRDYRPLLLIYNGFFFGVNGIGLPLLFLTTRKGKNAFACQDDDQRDAAAAAAGSGSAMVQEMRTEELMMIALKHMLLIFLVLMILDLGSFVIKILHSQEICKSQLLHQTVWMLIMFTALAVEPIRFSPFAAGIHMMTRCTDYAFLIIGTTSPVAKIIRRRFMNSIEILANSSICVHHSYYAISADCGNPFTLSLTAGYCAIRTAILAMQFTSDAAEYRNPAATRKERETDMLTQNVRELL